MPKGGVTRFDGGANLNQANLTGADLTGADLTNAEVDGAIFKDVKGLETVKGFDTSKANVWGASK